MADPRVNKLARLLVNYCVEVQPEQRVLLLGSTLAQPLVRETYREIIRAGAFPQVNWQDDTFDEVLFKEGNDAQVQYVPDTTKMMIEEYEAYIRIGGASNTRTLSGVDPQRQQLRQLANQGIFKTMMARAAAGELRWTTTLYPTPAQAQEADMSLEEYEDFVYSACHADKANPVAEWKKLSVMQQKLVDWLADKKAIRVKGPHADLTLSIAERSFVNSDGRRNMPSGEIFTGPVESSVNGWVKFSYPAIHRGREVEGIELQFEEGKVVKATAKKNGAFLRNVLDSDAGARYLGEFAIGTNDAIQRFTKSILYDEKIGGTIHMAVGAGYPETGSKNVSAVHWDMICDMRDGGKIWADDELFYDSGKFLIL